MTKNNLENDSRDKLGMNSWTRANTAKDKDKWR